MDFLSWLWGGSDGPRRRHLWQWLEARGYRQTVKTRPGITQTWVFEGAVLSMEFELDRALDWYLALKPRNGGLDYRLVEDWIHCIRATTDPGIRLPTMDAALRLHLGEFEAACEPDRLQATIDCLENR
jgi:hypothetical protein